MSVDIIYRRQAFCLGADDWGFEDGLNRYFVVELAGSSNCYTTDYRTGKERRSRDWSAVFFGTERQVMIGSIKSAAGFAGGCVKNKSIGVDFEPETYIGSTRRLLKDAQPWLPGNATYCGRTFLSVGTRDGVHLPYVPAEEHLTALRQYVKYVAQRPEVVDSSRRAWDFFRVSGNTDD